jgi:hypothetical protein
MPRKPKPAPIGEPSDAEPEESFAQIWEGIEPGARMSKGVYSIYKTAEGGMHIAYRPDGAGEDSHLPVPPPLMAAMIAASEGKGPLGRLRAAAAGMIG